MKYSSTLVILAAFPFVLSQVNKRVERRQLSLTSPANKAILQARDDDACGPLHADWEKKTFSNLRVAGKFVPIKSPVRVGCCYALVQ